MALKLEMTQVFVIAGMVFLIGARSVLPLSMQRTLDHACSFK